MKDTTEEITSMYFEAIRELAEVRFQVSALLKDRNTQTLSEVFVARAKTFPYWHIVLWNVY